MKTLIYNFSTLAVIVSMLFQSMAYAQAPAQGSPGKDMIPYGSTSKEMVPYQPQVTNTSNSQSSSGGALTVYNRSWYQRAKDSFRSIYESVSILAGGVNRHQSILPDYDRTAPLNQRLQTQSKIIDLFTKYQGTTRDVVHDTRSLLIVNQVLADQIQQDRVQNSRLSEFIEKVRTDAYLNRQALATQDDIERKSSEAARAARAQADLIRISMENIQVSLEYDIRVLQEFTNGRVNLQSPILNNSQVINYLARELKSKVTEFANLTVSDIANRIRGKQPSTLLPNQFDLIFESHYKEEIQKIRREALTGNPKQLSEREVLFETLRARIDANYTLLNDLKASRNAILRNETLLLTNNLESMLAESKTLEEVRTQLRNLRTLVDAFLDRTQNHIARRYIGNSVVDIATNGERVLDKIDRSLKLSSEFPNTRDSIQKVAYSVKENLHELLRLEGAFLTTLKAATQVESFESEYLAKVRRALPKANPELIREVPQNIRADARKSLEYVRNIPQRTGNFFTNLWNRVTPSSAPATPPGTEMIVRPTYELTTPESFPERTTSLKDVTSQFRGRSIWDAALEEWNRLKSRGFDTPQKVTGTDGIEREIIIKPVRANLATPEALTVPKEAREVTLNDIARLAYRAHTGEVGPKYQRLVLNLKDSSLVDGKESQVRNATVRTVETREGGKVKFLEITAQNGEKLVIDYPTDLEEVRKSSPLHLKDLGKHIKAAGVQGIKMLPIMAAPFYIGLLANTWINYSLYFESDPMAHEKFFQELTSVVGMAGFAAFIVGSEFGRALLKQIMNIQDDQDLASRSRKIRYFISSFGMAMGAAFSLLAVDLISVTAPCAKAMWDTASEKDERPDAVWQTCDQAYNAIISSDKIHSYVQSIMTIVASFLTASAIIGITAAAIQKGSLKSTTFHGFAMMGKNAAFSKPMQKPLFSGAINWYARVVGLPKSVTTAWSPIGIVLTAAHLILFFQAEHWWRPVFHKFSETYTNNGAELASSREALLRTYQNMVKSGFENQCDTSYGMNANYSTGKLGGMPDIREVNACRNLPDQLVEYRTKNQFWRDVVSFKFNMSFQNWQRYYGEYLAQTEATQLFYTQAMHYLNSDPQEDEFNAQFFNPIYDDDPLYGVRPFTEQDQGTIMPGLEDLVFYEGHPNDGELSPEFVLAKSGGIALVFKDKVIEAKIQRLANSIRIIEQHIEFLEKYLNDKNDYLGNTGIQTIRNYIQSLHNIRALFYIPMEGTSLKASEISTSRFVEGIHLLNKTYEQYKNTKVNESDRKIPYTLPSAAAQPNVVYPENSPKALQRLDQAVRRHIPSQVSNTTSIGDLTGETNQMYFKQIPLIQNSIRNIRRFIGDPRPLKKGEAFLVRFDDTIKSQYPDYLNILTRKGLNNPSEHFMWNAFCGVDYNSNLHELDTRENRKAALEAMGVRIELWTDTSTGIDFKAPALIDQRFAKAVRDRSLPFWCEIPNGKPMKFKFEANTPIRVKTFEQMNSKAGRIESTEKKVGFSSLIETVDTVDTVKFVKPVDTVKIQLLDDSNIPTREGLNNPSEQQMNAKAGRIESTEKRCATNLPPVWNNETKKAEDDTRCHEIGTWTTRVYDNSLDFLLDNIDPRISSSGIASWWLEKVNPYIDLAYELYKTEFFKMIDTQFAEALYTNDSKTQKAPTLGTILANRQETTGAGLKLPNSLASSYMTELDTYIEMLKGVFAATQKKHQKLVETFIMQVGQSIGFAQAQDIRSKSGSNLTATIREIHRRAVKASENLNQVTHGIDKLGKNHPVHIAFRQQGYEAAVLTAIGAYLVNTSSENTVHIMIINEQPEIQNVVQLAKALDEDKRKFEYNLNKIRSSLAKMLYSLVNQVEMGRNNNYNHDVYCMGLAEELAPGLVSFEAVLKALGLYIPITPEEALENPAVLHPLYAILDLPKYGFGETQNGQTTLLSTLKLRGVIGDVRLELESRMGSEKGDACFNKVNIPGLFDQAYPKIFENNAYVVTKNALFFPEHMNQNFLTMYIAYSMAGLKDEFLKNLKLNPAEKRKAEIAYIATNAIGELLITVHNLMNSYKIATNRKGIDPNEMRYNNQQQGTSRSANPLAN